MDTKIKDILPFTITPKKKKTEKLRYKFKYVQDLYTKNYKMLIKEIKDLNIWREIACSWVGRHNKMKMSILN